MGQRKKSHKTINEDQFNDPNISADELWDFCLHEYNNSSFISKILINQFYKKVTKITHLLSLNSRLLEVGCGAGASSQRIFKSLNGQHFEVSEYDERFIQKLVQQNFPFDVKQESVYKLNRMDNEFECVFLLEVLEHLENVPLALSELFRVSNKYVVISVPYEPFWRLANLIRFKYLRNLGNTPGHINHYNINSLRKLVRPYGEIKKIYTPFPWIIIFVKKRN